MGGVKWYFRGRSGAAEWRIIGVAASVDIQKSGLWFGHVDAVELRGRGGGVGDGTGGAGVALGGAGEGLPGGVGEAELELDGVGSAGDERGEDEGALRGLGDHGGD